MDVKKLQDVISKNGIKHKFIAEKLGISENLFAQKLLGNCKWKLDEVNAMRDILKLSKKETYDIFFA